MGETKLSQPSLTLFRIAFLVPDIEAAKAELTAALGLEWGDVRVHEDDGWHASFCYAKQGPPHLEVIQGSPGSPFDCGGTPRIDNLGFWPDDLETGLDATARHLEANGFELDVDGRGVVGRPRGFTFHRGRSSGLRLELGHSPGIFYERLLCIPDPGTRVPPLRLPVDALDASSPAS